jgi:hypothetical protein
MKALSDRMKIVLFPPHIIEALRLGEDQDWLSIEIVAIAEKQGIKIKHKSPDSWLMYFNLNRQSYCISFQQDMWELYSVDIHGQPNETMFDAAPDHIVIPRAEWKAFVRKFQVKLCDCMGNLRDSTQEDTLEWVKENIPNNLLDPDPDLFADTTDEIAG